MSSHVQTFVCRQWRGGNVASWINKLVFFLACVVVVESLVETHTLYLAAHRKLHYRVWIFPWGTIVSTSASEEMTLFLSQNGKCAKVEMAYQADVVVLNLGGRGFQKQDLLVEAMFVFLCTSLWKSWKIIGDLQFTDLY